MPAPSAPGHEVLDKVKDEFCIYCDKGPTSFKSRGKKSNKESEMSVNENYGQSGYERVMENHGLPKCNRVQPRGGQTGICNGVQNSGCSGNIRKKYINDVLTPTSLSWGMGHMEQDH